LVAGTSNKDIGIELQMLVENKELTCVRSLEKQRKTFSAKIEIVRQSLQVMKETAQRLENRKNELETEIVSTKNHAATLKVS
jgi:uncharacterized protein YlxW (UPF0749 family)